MQRKQYIADYEIISLIAEGSYSRIFKAKHTELQCFVALKVYSKENLQNPQIQQHFNTEVAHLSETKHPFIVELFDVIENEKCYALVLEYIETGSLLDRVNSPDKLTEVEIKRLYCQIVMALTYLHEELKIVHCDLKLENILLDRHRNIRLIDFGFSSRVVDDSPQLTKANGSPAYVAPEILKGYKYGAPVDIWASGIVLYSLLNNQLPFQGSTPQEQLQQVMNNELYLPDTLSLFQKELLKHLLNKNDLFRITLSELRNYPLIESTYSELNGKILKYIKWYQRPDKDVFSMMQDIGYPTIGILAALVGNAPKNKTSAVYSILHRAKLLDLLSGIKVTYHSSKEKLVLKIPKYQKTIMCQTGSLKIENKMMNDAHQQHLSKTTVPTRKAPQRRHSFASTKKFTNSTFA